MEAGSGATQPLPEENVRAIKNSARLPLIVGGGIRTKMHVAQLAKAGANALVIGTAIERAKDLKRYMADFYAKPSS